MSKNFNSLVVLCLCALLTFSCKKEKENPTPIVQDSNSSDYKVSKDGKIVLGKKLENPYTVEIMQEAYDKIISKSNFRISDGETPIKVTHYYVRFLPQSWQQYDVLKADTSLKLYDIPLDYEVELHGSTYHDPSIPEGNPTWQYTSVPKDYKFDESIKFEILAELYLPEKDKELERINASNNRIEGKSFIDALVDEAMILTKNYSDTLNNSNLREEWNPHGFVRVWDTRLNRFIPLVGVKMRARRWFDITENYTNWDGWYFLSGFKRPAEYSLFFETGTFDVRTGTFGQAWINGPKQNTAWNVDIGNDVNGFYANIFRGAWRYHYGNIAGLKRPGVWGKMKLCAYDGNNTEANGDFWGNWDFTGVLPDIRIWRQVNGRFRDSDEIFSTTIHEVAHASHAQLLNDKGIGLATVTNQIAESWAVAVQWLITSMEYRERGIEDFVGINYDDTNIRRLRFAYQFWNRNINNEYTSLFIDLIDDHNQVGRFENTAINDNVRGYTLNGIESTFLHNVHGIDTWVGSLRRILKDNRPEGVTNEQIDELLNQFN